MKLISVSVALVACLALAGCGDDKSTSSDRTTLTKAEVIKQGDAICRASQDRINKASASLATGEPTEAQATAFITDTLVPELEGQIRDLRKLVPPAADAAKLDAMLDSLAADVAKAKQDPRGMLTSDGAFVEAGRLAEAYGFQVCAKS